MKVHESVIFSYKEILLIAACAVSALALGYWGLTDYHKIQGSEATVLDILYSTINLFFLNTELSTGGLPPSLEIARWLAPATLSYTAVSAIASLMRSRLELARIGFLRRHTVICGLDSVSLSIAAQVAKSGDRVVIIDANPQNKLIGAARRCGAYLIIGNAVDSARLNQANIRHANNLLVMTKTDHSNLEITHHAYTQRKEHKRLGFLNCATLIDNRETESIMSQQPIFVVDEDNFSARIFNYEKLAARWLLNEFGPDRFVRLHDLQSEGASILLVGATGLLEELVLRLAAIGHYGQRSALNLHVVAPNATQWITGLIDTQPALNDLLNISAYDLQITTLNIAVAQTTIANIQPNILYAHSESPSELMSLSQAINNLNLDCLGIICEASNAALTDMLDFHFESHSKLHYVKVIQNSCTFDTVINARNDSLAKAIHENYVAEQKKAGDTPEKNSSLIAWKRLPEPLKNANRNQADHFAIKYRILSENTPPTKVEIEAALTPEKIEQLAIMEHNRWVAEKRLAGWRYHNAEKDTDKRLSPSLIEWEKLPESEKQKDRDAVHHIPDLLRLDNSTQNSK